MRYADIALFLVPIGLIVAWLAGLRGLSLRGVVAALLLLAGLGAALVWFGHEAGFRGQYRPAQWQDGQVIESRKP